MSLPRDVVVWSVTVSVIVECLGYTHLVLKIWPTKYSQVAGTCSFGCCPFEGGGSVVGGVFFIVVAPIVCG